MWDVFAKFTCDGGTHGQTGGHIKYLIIWYFSTCKYLHTQESDQKTLSMTNYIKVIYLVWIITQLDTMHQFLKYKFLNISSYHAYVCILVIVETYCCCAVMSVLFVLWCQIVSFVYSAEMLP